MTKLKGVVGTDAKLIGRIVPQTNINVKVSSIGKGGKPYEHPDTHPASMIEEEDNRMFMTMTEKEELQGLLERETFVHTQIEATKEWIISHPLDKHPAVAVVDSAGSIVIGEVDYISKSIVRLRFTAEFSGKAYLN